ncbi:DUF3592 domain-containing protein [Halomonas sp. NCCP-2165]|nr:DUF3592 domain-containing protein [Halomonas sp. NCCP-2165]GKW49628.1 hypothetical protein NCCP2165_18430 [Halomonas sp. NCCP-2165]
MSALLPWLVALAAALGALFSGRAVWRRRDVRRWPRVEAVVVGAAVEELEAHATRRDRHGPEPRYRLRVRYRFRVGERSYEASLGRFDGAPDFASRRQAEAALAEYAEGRRLWVRYRPDDPHCTQVGEAVIPYRRLGLCLFLAAMALVALWLAVT